MGVTYVARRVREFAKRSRGAGIAGGVVLATWHWLNEDMNFVLGLVGNVHPKALPFKLLQRTKPAIDLFSCLTGRPISRFSVSLCQRRSHFLLPRYAPQSLAKKIRVLCRHSSSNLRTAGCFSELSTRKDLFVSGTLLQRWVHSSSCLLNNQLPPNSPSLIKTVCAVLLLVKWGSKWVGRHYHHATILKPCIDWKKKVAYYNGHFSTGHSCGPQNWIL